MKIFIGAENIISPLGSTAEENFATLVKNLGGISLAKGAGFGNKDIFLSKFKVENSFDDLLHKCLGNLQATIDQRVFSSAKTLLLLSTTKGNIQNNPNDPINKSVATLKKDFGFVNDPVVISNACASGVVAINTAARFIRASLYNNVIVIGCDIVSDFVIYGFQSLFAISDQACAPFDKDRTGITLGEACAALVLSDNKNIFSLNPIEFVEGTSSNDANHISGPSRTGEGLYRTVKKTLELSGISKDTIDFISAHGTATVFNDDMESMAFDRLGMNEIPLNSLKGYFGHTLGAAGVVETAVCMQSMRNKKLIKSLGFKTEGTVKKINVLTENVNLEAETVLKTASGFGGVNASLLLRKI